MPSGSPQFDIVRFGTRPPEAHAPLIVYTNTVLAGAIAFQLLQPISGRQAQVLEPFGCIEHDKLAKHRAVEIRWKAPRRLAAE